MTKEEYETLSQQFRDQMNAEFEKPESERDIPETLEWFSFRVISSCETPGCSENGLHRSVEVSEPLDGVYKVLCGMCNRAVHNLDPMLSDDEDYRLTTRYSDGSSWLLGS